MPSEAQLAQFSKYASSIYIIAAIITIESANETQKPSEDIKGSNNSSTSLTPEQLIALASKLYLTANIIFFKIAIIRLKKAEQAADSGKDVSSITPNVYTTSGWLLSVLGGSLRVIGNQIKTNQSVASKK